MGGCVYPDRPDYDNIANEIKSHTPICIGTKDTIPGGSALSCDIDGGNDTNFRMMACKATFDYLK